MSTDIKLCQALVIQSGGSFCSWLDNLGRKALTNVAVFFG